MPTTNFALFQTAEQLGRTVREVLTGQPAPLSNMEDYLWRRYRLAKARVQQQQQRQQVRV